MSHRVNSTGATHQHSPSERALTEAAEWRVVLAEDDVPDAERSAFRRWLEADSEHALAWQEMETTWNALAGARRPAARLALERTYQQERHDRRRLLGAGAGFVLLLLTLLPVVWLSLGIDSPSHLFADRHTAIGERRTLELPDGSRLVLDTATAVEVDFDTEARRIRLLDGRVFIDVAPDPDRPLEVVTAEGRARALGTRFSVQRLQLDGTDTTRVSVYESRVALCPPASSQGCQRLTSDQRADAASNRVGPVARFSAPAEPDWVDGYLHIENRPVAAVLAELARYHPGVLRYDTEELAGLEVSGVLPLDDTGRALKSLTAALPLEVSRYTPWMIAVKRKTE
ncbi:MAG: FecR family protein [Halomonas sp.]